MRSLLKVGALALTTTVASAAFVGCSSDGKDQPGPGASGGERAGSIGLNLVPVSGVTINQVHYVVTQGMTVTSEGDLPTPGTASTFSFGVPLPVGLGYSLSLSAESAETGDNITCTGAFGPFDIAPNANTDVTITLTCVDNTNGQVIGNVNVVTDACPRLRVNYAVATPSSADVGGSIAVLSSATDLDGRPVTYEWSVAGMIGNFTPANAQNTTFNCTEAGSGALVTVTADNGECTKSLNTRVSCNNVLCGNGVLDPGETCDTALDPTCPGDCTRVCGDGQVESGEACEPPGTNVCMDNCQTRPPLCGDGFLTPPEACDGMLFPPGTPAGSTCSPTCVLIPPVAEAACGNGIVEMGETCDPMGGNPYSVNDCGGNWGPESAPAGGGRVNDCNPITTAACLACEQVNCSDFIDCSFVPGNSPSGVSRRALCNEVLDCERDTNCGRIQAIDCYCGTASFADCSAGNGNGACRAAIERGLETTAPATILERFLDSTFGGGHANARVDCDTFGCPTQCFTAP